MKKVVLSLVVFAIVCVTSKAVAQDIPQNQVPSVILNHFQQNFSKASDVEWEKDWDNYKVEFETGMFGSDQEVWYDKTGKIVRHKEDIKTGKLPKNVVQAVKKNFKGLRIGDVTKITEGSEVVYTMELKDFSEEWDVAIDANGKILRKMRD